MLNDFSGRPVAKLNSEVAALQAAAESPFRVGTIQLSGANPTRVNLQDDAAAYLIGSNAGPFDLSTDGLTFVVTVDGTEDTATFNCAAGTSVSGDSPSTDITGEVDTKIKIAVNGGTAAEVTLDKTGKNTGALIAAELQSKIRALGGAAAAVTVGYGAGVYTVTSGTKGTGASIVITPAASGSLTEELKLGVAGGGTETAGTGDFVNAAAATIAEVLAVLAADLGDIAATSASGKVKITGDSDTVGTNSSIIVGAGTANSVLGFTGSATVYGAQGLGYDTDMDSGNYVVVPVLLGASATDLGISVANKTAGQFDLVCETTASTATVDLFIVGAAAD